MLVTCGGNEIIFDGNSALCIRVKEQRFPGSQRLVFLLLLLNKFAYPSLFCPVTPRPVHSTIDLKLQSHLRD